MLADLGRSGRAHLSLATVVGEAATMTRIDRKYFVPIVAAGALLDELGPDWGLLAIGDRRTTQYRSTYFDSQCLQTVRAHVQGRRRRWKSRSRLYVEDGLCRVEVKVRGARGHTVKTVAESPAAAYGTLSHHDRGFVARTLAQQAIHIEQDRLHPTMEVSYERMTLARTGSDPARMTLDWGVTCRLDEGRVWLDEDHVLVETKGGLRPSDADRLLLSLGVRPRSFSKYAAAASLLRTGIPDNHVRDLRGRILHSAVDQPLEIRSHSA